MTAEERSRGLSGLPADRIRELSLAAIVAAIVLVFGLLVENLWSGTFFVRVTTGVAITAMLAAAQTVVILTRNIDLSLGSMVGVSAYLTGEFLSHNPEAGALVAIPIAIGVGCLMGLINGSLVSYGKVPSIIVRMGMLAVYRTWLIEHAEAQNVTATMLPDWLNDLSRMSVASIGDFHVRFSFALAVGVVVVLQVAAGRLQRGRWLYAVGSNPQAAEQAGLPVARVTLGAFVIAGALAGLAGVLFILRVGTITVD